MTTGIDTDIIPADHLNTLSIRFTEDEVMVMCEALELIEGFDLSAYQSPNSTLTINPFLPTLKGLQIKMDQIASKMLEVIFSNVEEVDGLEKRDDKIEHLRGNFA